MECEHFGDQTCPNPCLRKIAQWQSIEPKKNFGFDFQPDCAQIQIKYFIGSM